MREKKRGKISKRKRDNDIFYRACEDSSAIYS